MKCRKYLYRQVTYLLLGEFNEFTMVTKKKTLPSKNLYFSYLWKVLLSVTA